VALNSLIRIEIAPHHDMPVGAYFVTIVASHVPVHFNVTLGVVPVAGKGELVPAPGDILTKRLHGLYPHPFATFNTTVNLMGVYKLGVFQAVVESNVHCANALSLLIDRFGSLVYASLPGSEGPARLSTANVVAWSCVSTWFRAVVFIEDDTDIYVEIVYQLKRAGLAAFQQVRACVINHDSLLLSFH
jgi:hypothetical protein